MRYNEIQPTYKVRMSELSERLALKYNVANVNFIDMSCRYVCPSRLEQLDDKPPSRLFTATPTASTPHSIPTVGIDKEYAPLPAGWTEHTDQQGRKCYKNILGEVRYKIMTGDYLHNSTEMQHQFYLEEQFKISREQLAPVASRSHIMSRQQHDSRPDVYFEQPGHVQIAYRSAPTSSRTQMSQSTAMSSLPGSLPTSRTQMNESTAMSSLPGSLPSSRTQMSQSTAMSSLPGFIPSSRRQMSESTAMSSLPGRVIPPGWIVHNLPSGTLYESPDGVVQAEFPKGGRKASKKRNRRNRKSRK
jgi:hypothetical protein